MNGLNSTTVGPVPAAKRQDAITAEIIAAVKAEVERTPVVELPYTEEELNEVADMYHAWKAR